MQSITMQYYKDDLRKKMSMIEMMSASGGSFGPFMGSALFYLFGY